MDWIPVLLALGILGVLGLVFGVMLTAADKKLAVETDPRVAKIRSALGGANCGACGFAGCDALAEAIANGTAAPDACPSAQMEAIGEIMGIKVEAGEKKVARVICMGNYGFAKERYEYDGYASCATAAGLSGGPKLCRFSCIGLGDCKRACKFGAISIENGIAHIDEELCRSCGNCVAACPRQAIALVPVSAKVTVMCRNSDVGRVAVGVCMKACIACGRCVKECQYGAITVENGFARIDMDKCTRCGACAKVCPRGCIQDLNVKNP